MGRWVIDGYKLCIRCYLLKYCLLSALSMKILILASNPRKDLNLDDELRIVQSEIDRSAKRDQFSVVKETGVPVGDLQRLMHRHKPEIIHFCGHGSGQEGLIFKVDGGGEQRVRASALASLFRLFESVKCVLLNACYSEEQATAIAQYTDYVIGMSNTIQDNAAIAFSKGFYTALGEDCSIERSFEFGKNAIQLEVSESSIKRSGATAVEERKAEVVGVVETTELKEHEKPCIFIRGKEQTTSDLDQRRSSQSISDTKRDEVLLKIDASLGNIAEKPKQKLETNITSDQPRSHETRAVPQWNIDQPLKEDTKVKQYRDRVREFLSDRKLSTLEVIRLERLRKDLGLSEAEASRILAEEQEPIRRSQDEYEAMLIGLIEAGYYPLDAAMQAELQAVQQELRVTDEEVATIAPPILAAAEEDYQARLVQERQQEYEQKLQRYGQEFTRAIAAGYPIEESVRAGLTSLQQSLELRDEDVARIEQPLIAPQEAAYQHHQEKKRQLAEEEQHQQLIVKQQKAQQEQEQKLQCYEREFSRVIEGQYPLELSTRKGLERIQQSLGLSDEEIARIEEPIYVSKEAEYQHQLAEEQRQRKSAEQQRELEQQRQEEARKRQQEQERQQAFKRQLQEKHGSRAELASERRVSYARLKDLLKAKKWEKANQETADRMCEVMSKHKEGWLSLEDIQNFPCSELRTIDQIWVEHSDGRFGFSVQKKIWQNCSSTDYSKQWNKFGSTVGWKKSLIEKIKGEAYRVHYYFKFDSDWGNEDWKSLDEMTLDISAPEGHMPVPLFIHSESAFVVAALFSRTHTCKL